jgi:formylglycine-generating enzyme required for sulfatase activity
MLKKYSRWIVTGSMNILCVFLLGAFLSPGVRINSDGLLNKSTDTFIPYVQSVAGSDAHIEMQAIKGGEYLMGDNNQGSNEKPQHLVIISDFYMSTYEITWDQYELFLERQIDHVEPTQKDSQIFIEVDAVASATPPYVDMSHGMGKEGFPVVNVTQYAALTFCKWLSAKTGKFYRLPTEAEWEYACRAGSSTQYSFGDSEEELEEYGWYAKNSNKKYHKIGKKKPNAFGLYDMHGNVAEWTMDQYTPEGYNSSSDPLKNPWTRPSTLYPRVVRGGSWIDTAVHLRSSSREASSSEWKRIDPQIPKSLWWHTNAPMVGFRIISPRITPSKEEIDSYWLEAIDDF